MRADALILGSLFCFGCAGSDWKRGDASSVPSLLPPIDRALARGARFLLGEQSEDGAWQSKKYSALADGRALTPIVLSALLFAPPLPEIEPAYRRGVDYVATLVDTRGELAAEPLNYPVYALSGAILVLSVPANRRHARALETMIRHLEARQLTEELGWSAGDASYGGWGYYHDLPAKPASPERHRDDLLSANVTSTLFAAGALALGGVPLEDPRFEKALHFVKRAQNFREDAPAADSDGGFFFTPESAVQNKAGETADGYRSYGTVSADGLRLLLRLGVPRDDPRVRAATRWILDRFSAERVPGDYPPDREILRDSAYHYWAWSAAHALMLLGPAASAHPNTRDWPSMLAAALMARQRADGSFRNDAADLREDDPLVATPLGLAALAICRSVLAGELRTSIAM